jgi:hypothetical protein
VDNTLISYQNVPGRVRKIFHGDLAVVSNKYASSIVLMDPCTKLQRDLANT